MTFEIYFYTICYFSNTFPSLVANGIFHAVPPVPQPSQFPEKIRGGKYQKLFFIEVVEHMFSFFVLIDQNRGFSVKFSSFQFTKIPLRNKNFHPEHQSFKLCSNKENSQSKHIGKHNATLNLNYLCCP